MSLLDKFKNLIYDYEEVEVEKPVEVIPAIKEIKEKGSNLMEREKPTDIGIQPDVKHENTKIEVIETPTIKEENLNNVISERDLVNKNPNFKFPIEFKDEDLKPEKLELTSNNILKREHNKYREVKKDVEVRKTFKPSPIISPVYGILDKNYKKEELVVNKPNKAATLTKKNREFDTIRSKAFGKLENTGPVNLNNTIDLDKPRDILMNESSKEVTIEEAHENYSDYGHTYIKEEKKLEPKEIQDNVKLEPKEIETKEEVKDVDLTDDLFNLINSMYEGE